MLLTPISNPDEGKFNSNKEISFQAGKETHPFWAGAGGEAVEYTLVLQTKAIRRFVITEKAPTRAFSWLKAATTTFTFNSLLPRIDSR